MKESKLSTYRTVYKFSRLKYVLMQFPYLVGATITALMLSIPGLTHANARYWGLLAAALIVCLITVFIHACSWRNCQFKVVDGVALCYTGKDKSVYTITRINHMESCNSGVLVVGSIIKEESNWTKYGTGRDVGAIIIPDFLWHSRELHDRLMDKRWSDILNEDTENDTVV